MQNTNINQIPVLQIDLNSIKEAMDAREQHTPTTLSCTFTAAAAIVIITVAGHGLLKIIIIFRSNFDIVLITNLIE